MKRTRKPTHALTAADVMSRDLVTVHHRMTLRVAARVIGRRRAHVVPVTDDQGRFVGVLSAADLLLWAADDGPGGGQRYDTAAWTDWQLMPPGAGRADEARWHLTPDPAVASPGSSLAELVRRMRGARACCAVVIDARGRPVGVVSGADLLAAADTSPPSPPGGGRSAARRSPAHPAG